MSKCTNTEYMLTTSSRVIFLLSCVCVCVCVCVVGMAYDGSSRYCFIFLNHYPDFGIIMLSECMQNDNIPLFLNMILLSFVPIKC